MIDWLILGLRVLASILIYLFLGRIFYQLTRPDLAESKPRDIPELAQAYLSYLDDPQIRVYLGPQTALGRDPSNTLVLEDEFVSVHHALITYTDGAWWLTDLGSTNGTTCNDCPVQRPRKLHDGDIISFGRTHFRLELEQL